MGIVDVNRSLVASVWMLALLYGFFWSPLEKEAMEMHQRQLDPTEIIAIPYHLPRLGIHVLVTILSVFFDSILTGHTHSIQVMLYDVMLWSFALYASMILCGASPYEHQFHTFLASLYFSTLCCWTFGQDSLSSYTYTSLYHRLSRVLAPPQSNNNGGSNKKEGHNQQPSTNIIDTSSSSFTIPLQCILACTIPSPILLLYDRGWQIQRWPVPVIVFSTVGFAVGNIVNVLYDAAAWHNTKRGK